MLDLAERLKQQNNGTAWIDCNQRARAHHWVYEQAGEVGNYYRCKRCPVSTVVPRDKYPANGGTSSPVPPAPFLR